MKNNMVTGFRITGILEGLSLLFLLFIAMPIKYVGNDPSWVRVVGSLHGFLFIVYIAYATVMANHLKWHWKTLIVAYLCSSLPFGCFYFDHKYLKPLVK